MAAAGWLAFPCSRRQLRLDIVLRCGQSFRWTENGNGEWLGVFGGHVWRLKQDETQVFFQVYGDGLKPVVARKLELNHEEAYHPFPDCKEDIKLQRQSDTTEVTKCETDTQTYKPVCMEHIPPIKSEDKAVSLLQEYFQLDVNVDHLYQQWSKADMYFKKVAADFWGIRILRQDPVENLFSFICSSNNNIARISSMVDNLCTTYGQPIAKVDGKVYHNFPTISSLAAPGVEEKLRQLGFGYRAKFIAASSRYIMENHGEEWVYSLRQCTYEEAKCELLKLNGVGAKVADCVCLMSLGKAEAVPVDTHVWKFAADHYLPRLHAAKSLTDKLYQDIGNHFRNLWGEFAGWAQAVLFASELPQLHSMKSSDQNSAVTTRKKQKCEPSEKHQVTSSKVSKSSPKKRQMTSTKVSKSSPKKRQMTSSKVSKSSPKKRQMTSTKVSKSSPKKRQMTSTKVSKSSPKK